MDRSASSGVSGKSIARPPQVYLRAIPVELVTDRTLHLDHVRGFTEQGEVGERVQDRYYVTASPSLQGLIALLSGTREKDEG